MSRQITDPFIWEGEKWVFLAAENIYSLFDPEAYGLSPAAISTDCWKGFVIRFSVENKELLLNELWVYCENGIYPDINGVRADDYSSLRLRVFAGILKILNRIRKNEAKVDIGFRHYRNIKKRLYYSGDITIGQNFVPEDSNCAFAEPGMYERVYKLNFEHGVFQNCSDISGTYTGF